MPKLSASTPFPVFERVVISLYDGGVLSPAVLERVIGAFAHAGVDWDSAPVARSVDDRSLHEIVVLTMLPGHALRSASTSFMTVVEHIAGASPTPAAVSKDVEGGEPSRAKGRKKADADGHSDTGQLLAQLSRSAQPHNRRRSKNPTGRPVRTASTHS
jgi:hypothetical protein